MKKLTLILLLLICFKLTSQNFSHTDYRYNNLHAFEAKNTTIDSIIHTCISEINQDSVKAIMQHLQDFGTRFSLAPNRKEIASWIQGKFISMGYTAVLDSFEMTSNFTNNNYYNSDTTTHITTQYNVIATLTGCVNPESVYIISGHYDNISNNNPMVYAPGADDDASGIAAAMEIARVLKKVGHIPSATIKFIAFAAEDAMFNANIYGSQHYVNDAINNNENIGLIINNDMISNSNDTNHIMHILNHDPNGWPVKLAFDICLNYTCLTPLTGTLLQFGGDEYPFSQAGIPALFMQEHEWSPNYHTDSDTLGSCNMAYCAEITKVSLGMLVKTAETPMNIKDLFIVNAGDGHTLTPTWKSNNEANLIGYNVHIGRSPNNYDSVITTTDTFFVFSNLLTDTVYYIGVSALNNKGIESYIIENHDAPGIVTLSDGLLIIKDSKGGISSPTELQIDNFYDQICEGFNHSLYDATSSNKISLNIIGKYSSILWHINKSNWTSSILEENKNVLKNYLIHGGHILFTLYNPSKFIENNIQSRAQFYKGSFIYDFANISSINDTNLSRFSGAIPNYPDLPLLPVDSMKVPAANYYNHQLPNIEVIFPSQNGSVLYLYNSQYDSTTVQGRFINKPVGIENKGVDKNVVTLSFPLYYIKIDQAKELVHHVMNDLFHENYTGITEANNTDPAGINIYPNPAKNQINISFTNLKTDQLVIFDMCGTIVYNNTNISGNSLTIDLNRLPKGVYILKVINGEKVEVKRIILS